jgi:hypothetical protein
MPYAHDLLEQAKHLANREKKRPRQASLRRAVSTAYYALSTFSSTKPASCPLLSAFCFLPSAFCFLPSAFCLLPPAFCRLHPAARLLPPEVNPWSETQS